MPDNNTFIIAAYTVFWAGLLGYLVRLGLGRAESLRRLTAASARHSGGMP